ncbi:M91 family zinc metallopeptidase [Paraburkholderia phymatum]|uniref:Uncharacterized protein n=1 Tax=Paraburkholderia phymatum (strain DSM 17167 / CIP 108236 / LMG 21445 / STM815) TaxID=391038 RepID=B2JVT4_PARP8|nr:M91 family zinc metallopeptidase [Paraburkholderia phymatum]ACC75061.1 hypothetical protein Bphy_5998 [Paraburkholderia phymatum STM815]
MLTRAQFVTHLTAANRSIYLGGPTFARTQSAMIPVVNAVDQFNVAATGANLLVLIQAIGNLPAAKKVKYANALSQLYNTFPNPIYVTVNPFTLHTGMAPGIGVVRSGNVPSHQVDAVLALQTLDNFAAGHTLLDDLCTEVAAGHRVAIADAVGTASGGNECAIVNGMPDDYQTDLAAALNGSYNAVGNCISGAMTAMGHAPALAASFNWLETQIDNTPVYQLQGAPSVIPSSVTCGANWISAATLQSWVSGHTAFPAGVALADVDSAKLVIGTVLAAGATRGIGGHTRVRWNASNLTSAGTARPPYIGLGHELIHALHNMRGNQPGVENGTTTALYEYLCVGLGPYAAFPNTENALRAGAGVALRPYYAP